MEFITEDDLRVLYRKEPFTKYAQKSGARLTPSARQFLIDKKINMYEDIDKVGPTRKSASVVKLAETDENRCHKRVCNRINTLAATFLLTAEELLQRDPDLAQNIIYLSKHISNAKSFVSDYAELKQIDFESCTCMNESNFLQDLGDCFEITELNLVVKGKEVLNLHKLRCELREFELNLLDLMESCSEECSKCYQEILIVLRQMINKLSQLICLTLGGKTCRRKT